MWSISEVKQIGKDAFKANYWLCVLAAFLMSLFLGSGVASRGKTEQLDPNAFTSLSQEQQIALALTVLAALSVVIIIALIIKIFLANPIIIGGCTFFKENVKEAPAPFSWIKTGFQDYGHTFATMFLRDLYLVLWTMLLVVPGIIKAYSYRMVPYILADNPELSANEVITRSREMMNGNKWRAFLLDLSFIGWILLGVLTLGLGLVFWTVPYMQSTEAALYLELKGE